jgi:hypothetical protein
MGKDWIWVKKFNGYEYDMDKENFNRYKYENTSTSTCTLPYPLTVLIKSGAYLGVSIIDSPDPT